MASGTVTIFWAVTELIYNDKITTIIFLISI